LRSVAAYSGGTVWAFHPLPFAAGVSVELRGAPVARVGLRV